MSQMETSIDYEAVRAVATGFSASHTMLKAVNVALEALMLVLKTTAFMGLVGGTAVERYLANIQPHIDKIADLCEEFATDLRFTADRYEQAEAEESTSFT